MEFSTTQLNINKLLASKIELYNQNKLDFRDVIKFANEDQQFHITVKNGLHTKHIDKLLEIVKNYNLIGVELGEISSFDLDGYGVLFLKIKSEDLSSLNEEISKNIYHTQIFFNYYPHLTLAYLKNKTCNKYINDDIFKGIKINFKNLTFNTYDNKQFVLPFGNNKEK